MLRCLGLVVHNRGCRISRDFSCETDPRDLRDVEGALFQRVVFPVYKLVVGFGGEDGGFGTGVLGAVVARDLVVVAAAVVAAGEDAGEGDQVRAADVFFETVHLIGFGAAADGAGVRCGGEGEGGGFSVRVVGVMVVGGVRGAGCWGVHGGAVDIHGRREDGLGGREGGAEGEGDTETTRHWLRGEKLHRWLLVLLQVSVFAGKEIAVFFVQGQR